MKNKVEIIPAILPHDWHEIMEKIERIKGLATTVQIDICDGHFVPTFTWPYKKKDDNFDHLIHEEEGLPGWEELDFEFDLMVDKPEEAVEGWVAAGATRIILHAEAKGDLAKAVQMLQGRVEVGLALNIDTPIEMIQDSRFKIHEGGVQFIQLMGIDHIGFQGQEFDDKVVGRVKQVRLTHPGLPISIDGGVSLKSAPALIAAGADRLVVGSAIFNEENAVEAFHKFQNL